MTETEGIVPRPTDVIGNLEYEIDKGGNSATINAMIAARDEIIKLTAERDEALRFGIELHHANNHNAELTHALKSARAESAEWREACLAHGEKAERAERELAAAVAKENEECAKIADQERHNRTGNESAFERGACAASVNIAAAIRARSNAND